MTDCIAVLNAGSSSIKFAIHGLEDGPVQFRGQVEAIGVAPVLKVRDAAGKTVAEHTWSADGLNHEAATLELVQVIVGLLGREKIAAVGHRVVHGGIHFARPVRVDDAVLAELDTLVPLAPLHQPHNLAPIRTLFAVAPHLPQVGCFDTAFHTAQPALAQAFALPPEITGRGIRRYGFHGLSYEYIASVLPELDPALAHAKVIVAHLGNGASLCALQAGRSVATTMSFTALDGLPMGTRSGSLDPGVILYLLDEMKMGARDIERLLYRQSGLLGVSGISSDMRKLSASADPRARQAIDLFAYRAGREIGSLAAALEGLDAIVFTAGIGEHSASVRAAICRTASWLGLSVDEAANEAGASRISRPDSRVSAWVVPTNEELMIARHARRLLAD